MNQSFVLSLACAAAILLCGNVAGLAASRAQTEVDAAVARAFQVFPSLKTNELAATLIDLSTTNNWGEGAYRGSVPIYPASVVKLFYLEAAHRWMEEGKLKDSEELRRAMKDMIVDSYNEATHYVLDLLTDTTSGPELPPAEMARWAQKRNAVNRYFWGRGYAGINANQKPWCEGPYGRDRIFVGQTYTNRNALSTDATARLFQEIVTASHLPRKRCEEMMELLRRDPASKSSDPDDQAHGFTGPAVPAGAKLWSKAGWTSVTRHDAACVELANGRKAILVIFTVNHSNERGIIPAIARELFVALAKN